ncbi:DUF541 domain-containing protein [Parasedimentitalea marina]|uniref:DUF541 domain-containing protein n=1 Tax=Parasedimentitalea marina TaxID=2483033 RepID=A0A3T0N109_9RHOB|nr:SIMPL domain-containing protein [Parasedimentitalea marina]AZV77687.1 DUF541 domain-containing protein [Parasedimentitalea marina]
MKSNRFLVSAVLLVLSGGVGWSADISPLRQIAVSGEAHIEVPPSQALIALGVVNEADQAGDAMRVVSKSMVAVIDRLHVAGIDPGDIQTQQISVSPNRRQSGSLSSGNDRKIASFTARNTVQIRVRDLDDLGEILDQVLQAGANEFRGLQFGVADTAAVRDQIRGAAVKDAIRKAEQLATAAGVTLGPVLSITDTGGGGGRPMPMEMARSTAIPIEAGQLSFSHTVSMVFEISAPVTTD